jgi:hypothetical protein
MNHEKTIGYDQNDLGQEYADFCLSGWEGQIALIKDPEKRFQLEQALYERAITPCDPELEEINWKILMLDMFSLDYTKNEIDVMQSIYWSNRICWSNRL